MTGGPDGLRVWDLVSKTCALALSAYGEVFRALVVDFHGERAVCGTAGGSIKVWNLSVAAAEAAAASAAATKAAEAAARVAAAASSASALTPATLSALGEEVCCSGSRAPTDAASGLDTDTAVSESAWGTDHGCSSATDNNVAPPAQRRTRRGGQNRRARGDRGGRARTGAAVFGENTGPASSLVLREVTSIVADFRHSRVLTCASDGTLQTWEVPQDFCGTSGATIADTALQDSIVKVTSTLEGHQRSVAALSCE